jgi:hypothetical protein
MTGLAAIIVAVACGCGRIAFDPITSGGGGGSGPLGDGASAGDVTDVAPQPLCGSTVLLFDDFEDGVVAPEWTVMMGAGLTVSETGGFLQIQFANSNVAMGLDAGYVTTAAFDFTGGCLDLELVSVPDPTQTAQTIIEIHGPTGRATLLAGFDMLSAEMTNDTGEDNYYSTPLTYDAVAHRWLRIVENNGTWFFQTAPDAATYTTFFSMPYVWSGQSSTLYLDASSGGGGTSLGQVQFGSVRITGP